MCDFSLHAVRNPVQANCTQRDAQAPQRGPLRYFPV